MADKDTLPVVKGRYVKGEKPEEAKKHLSAHLKYIEFRRLGDNETRESRHIFNQDEDHITRKDVVADVMEHRAFTVYYHKLILSPGEHEHIDDFKQWTRDIMRGLEERKGIPLHWYAVEHHNTDNPHVHILIAGATENPQDVIGRPLTVRMDKGDYEFIRERGREHGNYEFYHEIAQVLGQLDREDDTTRLPPQPEPAGKEER